MAKRPTNLIKHRIEIDLNEGEVDLDQIHDELDAKIILTTLEYYGAVQQDTASVLKRCRRWLWKRIDDLGIRAAVREITAGYAKGR